MGKLYKLEQSSLAFIVEYSVLRFTDFVKNSFSQSSQKRLWKIPLVLTLTEA